MRVWLNWCRVPFRNIFTEADAWDELRKNALEATAAFFFDKPRPYRVRLYFVRDEVLSVACSCLEMSLVATSPMLVAMIVSRGTPLCVVANPRVRLN